MAHIDMTNKLFWKKKVFVTYILSILVFWIHLSSFSGYEFDGSVTSQIINFIRIFFKTVIVQVAVPLFFIISGVLFFRNYSNEIYISKIKQRIRTLVIPYICWNILNMFFYIGTSYTFVAKYFTTREKFVITPKNVALSVFLYKCNGPFWFVFCLIIFATLAPIINLLIKNRISGAVAIIIISIMCEFGIGLPTDIFYKQDSIVFYLIGCYIGKHYFYYFCEKSSKKQIIGGMLGIISAWIYMLIITYMNIVPSSIMNIVVFTIYGLSLWRFVDIFSEKITLKSFMNHSFYIFAMHVNVGAVVSKLILIIFPKEIWMAVPNFILSTIITLATIEVVCIVLEKYVPKAYSLLAGNR